MKQIEIFKITSHEQLKAISTPLRTKILMNLVKKEYTGQQLAELLGITRNNIYFHLKELEKHGVIHIVKKEEKNGIVQKYYKAVAKRFVPDEMLLPNIELIEAAKRVFIETTNLTKEKILNAPKSAFELETSGSIWKNIAKTYQCETTEEQFTEFLKDFRKIYDKHFNKAIVLDSNKIKSYYISLIGFQDDREPIKFK